jgi:hypothetical protein
MKPPTIFTERKPTSRLESNNPSLHRTQGGSLTAPAPRGSTTPFLDVFGMSLEDFYASLAQYPAVTSGEDWFEEDVIDASVVMPNKGLTLAGILQSAN